MSRDALQEDIYPRPLSGAAVETPPPALAPARVVLDGQYVCLEPMRADQHAEALYEASHASDQGLKNLGLSGLWPMAPGLI